MAEDTSLILTFIVIIAFVLISIFLVFQTKRAQIEYMITKATKDFGTPQEFDSIVAMRLKYKTKNCFIFLIRINDSDGLIHAFGTSQYASIIANLLKRYEQVFGGFALICRYENDRIVILLRKVVDEKALKELCSFILFETQRAIKLTDALKIELAVNIAACS